MKSKVIQGNNIDILKGYPDNYFDSIVTDPPYGIDFLQKDWDSNTGAVETWEECFRVLKPGGYILAFSAAKTYHNLATNIESVGFDIRDQIMWLYASGFPKAQDVGKAIEKREGKRKTTSLSDVRSNIPSGPKTNCLKCNLTLNGTNQNRCKDTECPLAEAMKPADNEWAGWKTALKPAHEPIVMARKPYKGSCVDNVLTHGVGALNIDATRIKRENEESKFPSNVLGEVTDYQKFFYCPKVSRAERHCGFEQTNIPTTSGGMYDNHGTGKMYSIGTDMKSKVDPLAHIPKNPDGMLTGFYENGESNETGSSYINKPKGAGNNHPTVKPVALMKYLIKLVTPQGGKVLDPFTGSGSTGMAAVELDYDFTGCELDQDYVDIANNRITAWKNKTDLENNPLPEEWFEEE